MIKKAKKFIKRKSRQIFTKKYISSPLPYRVQRQVLLTFFVNFSMFSCLNYFYGRIFFEKLKRLRSMTIN